MIKSEYTGVDLKAASFMELSRMKERARDSDPRWTEIRDEWYRRVRLADESKDRPTVVCLCGSTRFSDAFREANLRETLEGKIVLTIGCDMRSDAEVFAGLADIDRAKIKDELDMLHFRKIDLADEILVLNVGDYIGESTQREIEYARAKGRRIRMAFRSNGEWY